MPKFRTDPLGFPTVQLPVWAAVFLAAVVMVHGCVYVPPPKEVTVAPDTPFMADKAIIVQGPDPLVNSTVYQKLKETYGDRFHIRVTFTRVERDSFKEGHNSEGPRMLYRIWAWGGLSSGHREIRMKGRDVWTSASFLGDTEYSYEDCAKAVADEVLNNTRRMPLTRYPSQQEILQAQKAAKEEEAKAKREIERAKKEREEAEAQRRALPPNLTTKVQFQDAHSFFPNNMLDAAERAEIVVNLRNEGKGSGYAVVLDLNSDNPYVKIPSTQDIGDIPPGESRKVEIPIQADLNAPDGKVTITIETKEKRGYDARTIKLPILVGHLDKPALVFASDPQWNDGSGLAEGNGNGIPENNERIELVAFLRNNGVGEARDVTVKLVSINPGLTRIKSEDRLSTIFPGRTEKAHLVFEIPRLFSDTTIRYRLEAEDALGASRTAQSFEIPFQQNVPILAYESRIVDEYGNPTEELTNDAGFVWEITPSNVGQNAAQGVRLSVRTDQRDITFERSSAVIGTLAPNRPGAVQRFPFKVPRTFAGTEVTLRMDLTQSNFASKPGEVVLPVRLRRPLLAERHEMIGADRNGRIQQGRRTTFSVTVRNDGDLEARGVKVSVDVRKQGIMLSKTEEEIGTLPSRESRTVSFDMTVQRRAAVGELPIMLAVRQSDGFEGIQKTLTEYEVKKEEALVAEVQGVRREQTPRVVAPSVLSLEPIVAIAYPADGETVREETVFFKGTGTARGEGKRINEPVITVNGERQHLKDKRGLKTKSRTGITIESVGEGQVRFSGYISLKAGTNTIRVRALDSENLSEEQTITVTREGKMGTIWAVVVGVSRYRDTDLNLQYADRDAREFRNFLKSPQGGGLDDEHIQLLTNEQATHTQILSALNKFLLPAREDDTVFLFLACHGVIDDHTGELYFLGHNADLDNLMGTAVSNYQLMQTVGRVIKAQKKVLYIDACHAGEFGMSSILTMRGERAARTNKLVLKLSEADPNLVIFSASGGSELSREDKRLGHGVFTYYLLKGLRGKANADGDNWVTVSELEDYLHREVSRATDNKQRPEVKARRAEFPLSRVK